jgi:plasmid stability protein
MKNVTVTLDDETAAWARVRAARAGISVSRLIGELLRTRNTELAAYDQAMRRFLARKPAVLRKGAMRYATRDELHDRAGLR